MNPHERLRLFRIMAYVWIALQFLDYVLTQVGLTFPHIYEANPLMVHVVADPVLAFWVKVVGTTFAIAGLWRLRFRPILPVWMGLNTVMTIVVLHNTRLILLPA